MKRCITIILASLYLITSVGATVNMHYCMGELVDFSLRYKQSENCSNCGMKKTSKKGKECCKDEQKRVKLDKHNRTAQSELSQLKPIVQYPLTTFFGFSSVDILSVTQECPLSNSPPGGDGIPLYLRNRIVRI